MPALGYIYYYDPRNMKMNHLPDVKRFWFHASSQPAGDYKTCYICTTIPVNCLPTKHLPAKDVYHVASWHTSQLASTVPRWQLTSPSWHAIFNITKAKLNCRPTDGEQIYHYMGNIDLLVTCWSADQLVLTKSNYQPSIPYSNYHYQSVKANFVHVLYKHVWTPNQLNISII